MSKIWLCSRNYVWWSSAPKGLDGSGSIEARLFTTVISRMLATHVVCGVASEAGCIFSEGVWSDDRPCTSPSVWVGRWGDSPTTSLRKFSLGKMARWAWSTGAAGARTHENVADGSTIGMFLWSRRTALIRADSLRLFILMQTIAALGLKKIESRT